VVDQVGYQLSATHPDNSLPVQKSFQKKLLAGLDTGHYFQMSINILAAQR